jgi:hypothetical protein
MRANMIEKKSSTDHRQIDILRRAGIINPLRMVRTIATAIDAFQLDLSGLTVVTEAASRIFAVTPVIAALAGAKKVYGLTRDSSYASADEVVEQTRALATLCHVEDRVNIVRDKSAAPFEEADIVTNLGFVRPIDESVIACLRPGTVITVMCEAWELRAGDIDLDACRKKGILVLGTNEHCPEYDLFRFSGDVAIQLLLEAQVEIHKSNIAVVSSDPFGPAIAAALRQAGSRTELFTSLKDVSGAVFSLFDAVLLADYNRTNLIIGDNGDITVEFLSANAPHITVVQFAGRCSLEKLKQADIAVYPGIPLPAQRMARTFAAIGARPVIELHAAGLKVGELGIRKKNDIKRHPLVQMVVPQ